MADNLEHTQGGNNVIEDTGDGRITGQEQEIIDVVNDAVASGDIKTPAKLEVENITALTDEQLNGLKCGDVVVKLTGDLKHSYKVTYKEEEQGICISYFACGYTETVAYDYVDGHWVFNSTDVKTIEDVTANPTLEGSEELLTGLQVGNTKFKCYNQDYYSLRLVLTMEEAENLPNALGISYTYFGEKQAFVDALNEALSQLAGVPIEVHTLMELRAVIDQLSDQQLQEVFLFIALLGAGLERAKASYEITYPDDAEPAVFNNVFQAGYFAPQYVYYISGGSIQNLALNFTNNVGSRPFSSKVIYCNALPSDVNMGE